MSTKKSRDEQEAPRGIRFPLEIRRRIEAIQKRQHNSYTGVVLQLVEQALEQAEREQGIARAEKRDRA